MCVCVEEANGQFQKYDSKHPEVSKKACKETHRVENDWGRGRGKEASKRR